MNTQAKEIKANVGAGRPRLVKAAVRAADREARLQKAREQRAKRELSLNAILNRAAGCSPRSPRAMFDALFQAAEG